SSGPSARRQSTSSCTLAGSNRSAVRTAFISVPPTWDWSTQNSTRSGRARPTGGRAGAAGVPGVAVTAGSPGLPADPLVMSTVAGAVAERAHQVDDDLPIAQSRLR